LAQDTLPKSLGSMSWSDPLTLPNGAVVPNRILKSACTEGLADYDNRVTERHLNLYRAFAQGGVGILLSGNIQVDRRYLERAGNVCIDKGYPHTYDARQRDMLKQWATVAKSRGSLFLGQLSCAGPRTPSYCVDTAIAPSQAAPTKGLEPSAVSRAATVGELDTLVESWIHAAVVLSECGWDGVQVHAAHGYLISSFLSPEANRRADEYGGELQNRARLLLRVVRGIKAAVPSSFVLSVKIHCSDFLEGGFDHRECSTVCTWLADAGVHLIEFSGAFAPVLIARMTKQAAPDPVANPAPNGSPRSAAFFVDQTAAIKASGAGRGIPMALTGGFVAMDQVQDALQSGACDMVGLARPMCIHPDDVMKRFVEGTPDAMAKIQRQRGLGEINWYYYQFRRLGDGQDIDNSMKTKEAIAKQVEYHLAWAKEYRKTLKTQSNL